MRIPASQSHWTAIGTGTQAANLTAGSSGGGVGCASGGPLQQAGSNHLGASFEIRLRICMRVDPNVEAQIGYAIRGLYECTAIEALTFNR